MMEPRRLLTLAAALNVTVCVGARDGADGNRSQRAPGFDGRSRPNDAAVGSAKTNERGDALVPVGLSERLTKIETDAQVLVDICESVRRVLIVERSVSVPLQEVGCTRRDMGGFFVVPAGELARDRRRRAEPDVTAAAGEGESGPAAGVEACANRARIVRGRDVLQGRWRDRDSLRRRHALFR